MRFAGGEEPSGASVLLMRTIGIRDLVLGLGTVSAARSPGRGDVRRWTASAFVSDSLDTVASLVAVRAIGRRDGLGAATLAFAFALVDLELLRRAPPQPAG